jgi:hypothetical protein
MEYDKDQLLELIKELVPYMINDVKNGLWLGPTDSSHLDHCEDCKWYEESVSWKGRISKGEIPFATLEMLEMN